MGSRMMHYCISSLISRHLKVAENEFLLGGIAPDVHKNMNEPKKSSHFIRENEAGISFVDDQAFYHKYLTHQYTDFHLGYYCHLISDEIWLQEVYMKKIKWLPPEKKKEAQHQSYRDFLRLNGKIADYYDLQPREFQIEPVHVDEIDYRYLPELIRDLHRDFEKMDETKGEALELLDFDEVVAILNDSVQACLHEVRGFFE
ncbi:hypothetical protein [Paenibacillus sp. Marseille-Q4541]|uniref:hypothetical protein n=1 Tax=Paenibacillus sp. Marseille-Q4541 TaxID=2831522 RepID=UPI001BABDB91|nr:hypothetical protein [Paenibacillus sp. Marseille-Q4541]